MGQGQVSNQKGRGGTSSSETPNPVELLVPILAPASLCSLMNPATLRKPLAFCGPLNPPAPPAPSDDPPAPMTTPLPLMMAPCPSHQPSAPILIPGCPAADPGPAAPLLFAPVACRCPTAEPLWPPRPPLPPLFTPWVSLRGASDGAGGFCSGPRCFPSEEQGH